MTTKNRKFKSFQARLTTKRLKLSTQFKIWICKRGRLRMTCVDSITKSIQKDFQQLISKLIKMIRETLRFIRNEQMNSKTILNSCNQLNQMLPIHRVKQLKNWLSSGNRQSKLRSFLISRNKMTITRDAQCFENNMRQVQLRDHD